MNNFSQTPENWTKASVRNYCDVQLGKMLQNDPSSERDELKPYLRAINIGKRGQLDLSHEFSMWIRPQEFDRFRLTKGDILVSEGGDAGRAAIFDVHDDYYFQNAINRVRPNHLEKIDPQFIYYWFTFLKVSGYVEMICNVATIPHFTAEKVKAAPLALPPLDTQRRIGRFLDEKTARIDGLIDKKRTLLDRLAEKRKSLISRAVTKGLNPSARMKSSGIYWLDDIPVHSQATVPVRPDQGGHHQARSWDHQARRGDRWVAEGTGGMSYFARSDELPVWSTHATEDWGSNWLKWSVDLITKRPTEEEQEALPYISNEDIETWTGKLLIEEPKPAEADSRTFQENDVLFNKLRPYLAKVYHATFGGLSSGELLCLRPSHVVEPRFLFYVLVSKGFIDKINAETFGAKMPRADWEIIGHQPLPLPPLDTQRRIARFLDEKTARTDATAKQVLCSIEYLLEYRSALITAAVTGQLAELQ